MVARGGVGEGWAAKGHREMFCGDRTRSYHAESHMIILIYQDSRNCALKRVKFTAGKLYLNIKNEEKPPVRSFLTTPYKRQPCPQEPSSFSSCFRSPTPHPTALITMWKTISSLIYLLSALLLPLNCELSEGREFFGSLLCTNVPGTQ